MAASVATFGLLTSAQSVMAAQAPIHFADLNWESGSLITEILRVIVEKGYDLPTDTLPGTTITLETALAKNDIQVIGEEWAGRSPVWVKAEAEGKVVGLGDTVKGPPKVGGCRNTWSRVILPKASSPWHRTSRA